MRRRRLRSDPAPQSRRDTLPPLSGLTEERLDGGNTHGGAVVRVGSTVRRPAGPWTPHVHALLCHLAEKGFDGAPRAHGLDDAGREILDYIEGVVIHPDHDTLVHADDDALAGVARVIRGYHDAVADFPSAGRTWGENGADPIGPYELVCHNDLAPWNLVRGDDGAWTFIDWDLAAPGRRAWDLGWALLGLIPLMPRQAPEPHVVSRRLERFRVAYGSEAFPDDVLAVAAERCSHEASRILRLGQRGTEPYAKLLADGHAETWALAEEYVRASSEGWRAPDGR